MNTESGNLVGAINEVFGDTIKEQVVNVLIEKGIEASTNESWVSLLNKLEEGSSTSGGLDIISATELPATGKENQICVITENPTDTILMSPVMSDISDNTEAILVKLSLEQHAAKVTITSNNFTTHYYIENFGQNNVVLPSYIYKDGSWSKFTSNIIYLMKEGEVVTEPLGGIYINSNYSSHMVIATDHLRLCPTSTYKCIYVTSQSPIDFTLYNKCVMKVYTTGTAYYSTLYVGSSSVANASAVSGTSSITSLTNISSGQTMATIDETEYTFDISSWTGEGYLTLVAYKNGTGFVYITEVYLY